MGGMNDRIPVTAVVTMTATHARCSYVERKGKKEPRRPRARENLTAPSKRSQVLRFQPIRALVPNKMGDAPTPAGVSSGFKKEIFAKEAADILGIHVTAVYEKKVALEGRKTPRGWVFSQEKCREYKEKGSNPEAVRKKSGPVPKTTAEGATAAAVFEALKDGMTPIDIVIQLHVPPEIVSRLTREYNRIQGIILLDGEQLSEIRHLPGSLGISACTTSAELLSFLRDSFGETACSVCHKRPRLLCQVCRAAEPSTRTTSRRG